MKKVLLTLFFILPFFLKIAAFEKVILWGHKLHSHTHSYVHNGFYRAFNYLGYPTYWFDDQDDVSDFDFANSLFITEGQVDHNIPLREDCQYMLHNCPDPKYQTLKKSSAIVFQVYTDAIFEVPDIVKVDTCIYYDLKGRCLYMPWATDLLPYEIDAIQHAIHSIQPLHQVYWVGTIGEGKFGNLNELKPFMKACEENGQTFIAKTNIDLEEHIQAISTSFMAPTIVGHWQKEVGYIPCRIFKNISYGQMGITNSKRVNELFDNKLVYNEDTYQLFYDAKKRLETMNFLELFELMDIVKAKHTFINRIYTLLDFLNLVGE